jgi:hypothetical protein
MTGDKDDYSDATALNGVAAAIRAIGRTNEESMCAVSEQLSRVADAIFELAEAARDSK